MEKEKDRRGKIVRERGIGERVGRWRGERGGDGKRCEREGAGEISAKKYQPIYTLYVFRWVNEESWRGGEAVTEECLLGWESL